jgi:uncharacterized protein with LGFP repeats
MADESDNPIHSLYLAYGGAAGVLGLTTSGEEEVIGARHPGRRCHYRGPVPGAARGISVVTGHDRISSCHRPPEAPGVVESTISWSTQTGAHVVHGEIRVLWLKMGAEGGELGYPVSCEEPTADGRGRQNRFEFGEIRWYPDTGAAASATKPSNPDPAQTDSQVGAL